MIKQIWFVKNVRRLINYLCVTIASFILLYSFASVLGLVDLVWIDVFSESKLLIIPLFSLICSSFFYAFSKKARILNDGNDKKTALKNQFLKDLIIGTNLIFTLVLSFIQLDIISKAKEIESFGLLPVYLCIIGGLIFYFMVIKKHKFKEKKVGD